MRGFVSDELLYRQLTVIGVMSVGQAAYAEAIRIISSGAFPLESLVSHEYPFEDAELAIRVLAREVVDGEEPLFVSVGTGFTPSDARPR